MFAVFGRGGCHGGGGGGGGDGVAVIVVVVVGGGGGVVLLFVVVANARGGPIVLGATILSRRPRAPFPPAALTSPLRTAVTSVRRALPPATAVKSLLLLLRLTTPQRCPSWALCTRSRGPSAPSCSWTTRKTTTMLTMPTGTGTGTLREGWETQGEGKGSNIRRGVFLLFTQPDP